MHVDLDRTLTNPNKTRKSAWPGPLYERYNGCDPAGGLPVLTVAGPLSLFLDVWLLGSDGRRRLLRGRPGRF